MPSPSDTPSARIAYREFCAWYAREFDRPCAASFDDFLAALRNASPLPPERIGPRDLDSEEEQEGTYR